MPTPAELRAKAIKSAQVEVDRKVAEFGNAADKGKFATDFKTYQTGQGNY